MKNSFDINEFINSIFHPDNYAEIVKENWLNILVKPVMAHWQRERMVLEVRQLKQAFSFPDEIFKLSIEPHLKENIK